MPNECLGTAATYGVRDLRCNYHKGRLGLHAQKRRREIERDQCGLQNAISFAPWMLGWNDVCAKRKRKRASPRCNAEPHATYQPDVTADLDFASWMAHDAVAQACHELKMSPRMQVFSKRRGGVLLEMHVAFFARQSVLSILLTSLRPFLLPSLLPFLLPFLLPPLLRCALEIHILDTCL